ncbi:MAG: DUF3800 domain-containing protein [Bacteroidota bacterium]
MKYHAYFDESGDLGWTLDKPYRKGGSSQYFTIAALILPSEKEKYINRFIKKFHKERGGQEREYKGADFSNRKAKVMARKIVSLLQDDDEMILAAATIKKADVPTILQGTDNSNILYNHMVQSILCPTIKNLHQVQIIPDKRSVPSGSQNSCADLIKHKLWCELQSNTNIHYQAAESHHNQRLQFIDWVANFVWRRFEDEHSESQNEAYELLSQILIEQNIFRV